VVTDENDCVYTSLDLIVEATTSSNEITILNHLKVFPNPASEFLNINLDSDEFNIQALNLVSIDGKNMRSINVDKNRNVLDISTINTGVYLLQVILEEDIVYKKIIVE